MEIQLLEENLTNLNKHNEYLKKKQTIISRIWGHVWLFLLSTYWGQNILC